MAKTKKKFILVEVSKRHYAVEILDTYRVFELQNLSQVPFTDHRIAGLTYQDGHLVTILATHKILGLNSSINQPSQCLLVRYENHYYAYLIDSASSIVDALISKDKRKSSGLEEFISINKEKITVIQTDLLLKQIIDHE